MKNILITGSRSIKSKIIVEHILNNYVIDGAIVIQGGVEVRLNIPKAIKLMENIK